MVASKVPDTPMEKKCGTAVTWETPTKYSKFTLDKNFSKNLLGDSGNYAKPSNTSNDINIERPSNDSTIIK